MALPTVVSVSEDAISLAILRMLELEKTVVEGAAATPLAAMMSGRRRISLPAAASAC